MDMSLCMELEHLAVRLDGLTNLSLLLSDAAMQEPNAAGAYKDSIALMYFLMKDLREKYCNIVEQIPRREQL